MTVAALLLALAASAAPAQPSRVELPKAPAAGGMPLDAALAARRSVRRFSEQPLALAQLSQLCWAAQGVTDAKGRRTSPSARATYPLELFVLASRVEGLAPGLYRYLPEGHRLERLNATDLRDRLVDEAVRQRWIKDVPAVFLLAWQGQRPSRDPKRAERWALVEVGLAAENLLLEAVSLGLGSTFVGGFEPAKAREVLGLEAGLEPVALLPVGKPAER